MKRHLDIAVVAVSLTLAVVSACAGDDACQTAESWEHALAATDLVYRAIAPGVSYASMEYKGKVHPMAYHVVKADLNDPAVRLGAIRSRFVNGGEMAADTLTNMVTLSCNQRARARIVAAINADYFGGRPMGIHIQDGEVINRPNVRSAFVVGPDGKPSISPVDLKVRLRFGETGAWHEVTTVDNCAVRNGPAVAVTRPAMWKKYAPSAGVAAVADVTDDARNRVFARIAAVAPAGSCATNGGNSMLVWSAKRELVSCLQTGEVVMLAIDAHPPAVEALGGGPRIVREGVVSLEYEDEGWTPVNAAKMRGWNPRSAAGIGRDGMTVYLVVVEGRKSVSQGLTAVDLAQLLVNLGCRDAISFDGGGSASLYTPTRFVINQKQPRPIKNGLAVFRKE